MSRTDLKSQKPDPNDLDRDLRSDCSDLSQNFDDLDRSQYYRSIFITWAGLL